MKLSINFAKSNGIIKPMNAVNNGPIYTKNADQNSGNMKEYTEANIPFARTHDAAFCGRYGGEHTVDITAIFPDFSADENSPDSYDFYLTDEYMETIMMAGTKPFFRLGQKIEHNSKKYGIYPPADFKKWAVICEHIIAHMNEGWADGHSYGIEYWEIWNEPDLYNKCWMGTPEQFYELYCITAKHLKARFPNLKIGGPAPTHFNEEWLRPFFKKIKAENVPLDFYSWHRYANEIRQVKKDILAHKALLDEYGYGNAESILDECNYVLGWSGEEWAESLRTEISIKGAAFYAAVMAECQTLPLDILMYYDARPCGMNGMFSMYTYGPLKTYYPIKAWGEMLGCESAAVTCDVPDIYAVGASTSNGKLAMVSYFTNKKDATSKTFKLELGDFAETANVYLLNETENFTQSATLCTDGGITSLTMEPNTVVLVRE